MTRPLFQPTLLAALACAPMVALAHHGSRPDAPAPSASVATRTVALSSVGAREGVTAADRPSLIVLITVDQFGAEYLQRFGSQMTGGIARLMKGGAWFSDAHHDHAITETAPGHASLLAGRFPRSTGIMMNSIGVDDDAAPLIASGYGPGASPRRFQGTTLVDWLRAADGKMRMLSVSMKDRGAILPIGKSSGDVYWYSPDGRFITSNYYKKSLPEWVRSFNDRQYPASFAGKTWSLLLPASAYQEPDSVPIESSGRDFTFPHLLPADPFDAVNLIRASPFIDDVVAAFAVSGVRAMELGAGTRTDLLSLSLSATDVIGHRFGPDSREIHDQVLRVDGVIGRFLDSLYAIRDSSKVTVVFTSDHGVGRIPELAAQSVTPPPLRVTLDPLQPSMRARLRAAGVDTGALISEQNLVLLDRNAFRRKSLNPDSLLDEYAALVRKQPGVARVDRFSAVFADSAKDPISRRWAHQFPTTVNIEMLITLTPGSTWGGNVASHGSPYDYDSGVPIIFAGFGVQKGKFSDFVRTVDIAPTLAAIAGVKPLEKLDGVPLMFGHP